MSEYKIVKPEKGIIGIMKGGKHIGYIENTSASVEVLEIITSLQSQLAMAEMVIEEYNENVDYYESELAGSWLTIRETAREYFNDKETGE
jgi:hypothetical protein